MLRFLHTADWQLGKPFGQFPDELSGRLSAARIEAVARIADAAEVRNIRHVLVAGDVWDSELPARPSIAQPFEIMGAAPDVHWWLIPGNHDPARAHGLWDKLDAPKNVHLLTTAEPRQMEDGVWLLPAPWTTRMPGRDLTQAFDTMQTPDGALRIGIAHGGTVDFAQEAQSATIADTRVQSARLDYLALGDWHGVLQVNNRCWYSGTPEPDRFPRNRPGRVLDVTVRSGELPRVEEIEIGEYHWHRVERDVTAGEDVLAEVKAALTATLRKTLLRTELRGALPRAEQVELEAGLKALSGRMAHWRDRNALRTLWAGEDLDALDLSGSVRVAAETLRADNDDVSEMALALLFDIAEGVDA